MSEVWTVRLCLIQTRNEPCQHTNCNAGCVKLSLTEDTAQGIACSSGLERFTACLANDSFKVDLEEPTLLQFWLRKVMVKSNEFSK